MILLSPLEAPLHPAAITISTKNQSPLFRIRSRSHDQASKCGFQHQMWVFKCIPMPVSIQTSMWLSAPCHRLPLLLACSL